MTVYPPNPVPGCEPLCQIRRCQLHRPAHERHGRRQCHQGPPWPRRVPRLWDLGLLPLCMHGHLACLTSSHRRCSIHLHFITEASNLCKLMNCEWATLARTLKLEIRMQNHRRQLPSVESTNRRPDRLCMSDIKFLHFWGRGFLIVGLEIEFPTWSTSVFIAHSHFPTLCILRILDFSLNIHFIKCHPTARIYCPQIYGCI